MNILVVGINYRSAPLELRESLSFNPTQAAALMSGMRTLPGVEGCVLLSTCNRTELYLHASQVELDPQVVIAGLCERRGLDLPTVKKHFHIYLGIGAVQHLFRVACGLDSMLLGENQILGQVRDAHAVALAAGHSGTVLNVLFRHALTLAKDVKTRTGIARSRLSLGSLAIDMLEELHGPALGRMQALVIGCGTMGKLALRNLHGSGIGRIMVTNRTHGTSLDLSQAFTGVEVVPYGDRYAAMARCDIIISATASPHYTVTLDAMRTGGIEAAGKTFIDLALPRDIDEDIAALPGVSYVGIDQLRTRAEENSRTRAEEARRAEVFVEEAVGGFSSWYGFREVLPLIGRLREEVAEETLRRLVPTFDSVEFGRPGDRERMKAAVGEACGAVVNRLLFSLRDVPANSGLEGDKLPALMQTMLGALEGRPAGQRMETHV